MEIGFGEYMTGLGLLALGKDGVAAVQEAVNGGPAVIFGILCLGLCGAVVYLYKGRQKDQDKFVLFLESQIAVVAQNTAELTAQVTTSNAIHKRTEDALTKANDTNLRLNAKLDDTERIVKNQQLAEAQRLADIKRLAELQGLADTQRQAGET